LVIGIFSRVHPCLIFLPSIFLPSPRPGSTSLPSASLR
jgi:hypothetical protein